jgi:hypothetical protein
MALRSVVVGQRACWCHILCECKHLQCKGKVISKFCGPVGCDTSPVDGVSSCYCLRLGATSAEKLLSACKNTCFHNLEGIAVIVHIFENLKAYNSSSCFEKKDE